MNENTDNTRSTPLYFGGRFGWIHAPAAEAQPSFGVVICSAFGQEEMCTHYGVMGLADELAAAGIPALRFDYLGTCNSDDHEISLKSFVEDTRRAVDCLRQHCGPLPVVLAGVRLGTTTLLSAASSVDGLQGVVLLAPVLSGKTYLREVRAAAAVSRLASLDPVPPMDSGEALNTNGFHWSGPLQKELAETDLTRMAPPHFPVLLLAAPQDRQSAKVAERWSAGGTPITVMPFPEYNTWMQDPTLHTNPVQAFGAVCDWLKSMPLGAPVKATADVPASVSLLAGKGFVEHPLRFGKNERLFGVLTLPAQGKAADVAALLLHEGSSYTIGNGRAYVTLARRLARSGIASFRIDLSATGDSPQSENKRSPHYDQERIPEAVAALDLLEQRGFPVAVAFGQCAGAYTAYQVILADPRVVGGMITNLQKFIWHYGDDIRVSFRDSKRSLKGYLRAMRNKGEWKRALSGKADVYGIARVLLKRGYTRTKHGVRSFLPPAQDSEMAIVHRQMRTLADRGVHLHLLFSDDDPGLAEMWMQFGRRARLLKTFAPVTMTVLKHADHHFNGTSARHRFFDLALSRMRGMVAEHASKHALRS